MDPGLSTTGWLCRDGFLIAPKIARLVYSGRRNVRTAGDGIRWLTCARPALAVCRRRLCTLSARRPGNPLKIASDLCKRRCAILGLNQSTHECGPLLRGCVLLPNTVSLT